MTKETIASDQVAASANIDQSVLPPEPHPPMPIPDPTGIALLLFAIIGISEAGSASIRGRR